jgi:hypothetical protein
MSGIDDPVRLAEVIEAFKALGGKARSKQIEDHVIFSRANVLPKRYQFGGWGSYRKTINQVIQVHSPGHQKYRGREFFRKLPSGEFELVGFNQIASDLSVESRIIDTHEAARKIHLDQKGLQKILEENSKIGNKGELLVMKYEKSRFQSAGRSDLADQIKHIALESVSEGYDIRSFDESGNSIFIEVKTSRAENHNFYITQNEYMVAKELREAYWLYRVLNCEGDYSIIRIRDPYKLIESGQWTIIPASSVVAST